MKTYKDLVKRAQEILTDNLADHSPDAAKRNAETLKELVGLFDGSTQRAIEANESAEMRAFWAAQSEWSQSVFGTDAERGPVGPLKHLAKEAQEAQEDPTDLMEFVDCLFLTFDATRRAGFTFDQLLSTAWRKLEINKARKWQKPNGVNEPVEHIRRPDEKTPDLFAQFKRKILTAEQLAEVLAKYKHSTVEDGFYYDDDDKCWVRIDELWEQVTS